MQVLLLLLSLLLRLFYSILFLAGWADNSLEIRRACTYLAAPVVCAGCDGASDDGAPRRGCSKKKKKKKKRGHPHSLSDIRRSSLLAVRYLTWQAKSDSNHAIVSVPGSTEAELTA
jgi:hypothetical protein